MAKSESEQLWTRGGNQLYSDALMHQLDLVRKKAIQAPPIIPNPPMSYEQAKAAVNTPVPSLPPLPVSPYSWGEKLANSLEETPKDRIATIDTALEKIRDPWGRKHLSLQKEGLLAGQPVQQSLPALAARWVVGTPQENLAELTAKINSPDFRYYHPTQQKNMVAEQQRLSGLPENTTTGGSPLPTPGTPDTSGMVTITGKGAGKDTGKGVGDWNMIDYAKTQREGEEQAPPPEDKRASLDFDQFMTAAPQVAYNPQKLQDYAPYLKQFQEYFGDPTAKIEARIQAQEKRLNDASRSNVNDQLMQFGLGLLGKKDFYSAVGSSGKQALGDYMATKEKHRTARDIIDSRRDALVAQQQQQKAQTLGLAQALAAREDSLAQSNEAGRVNTALQNATLNQTKALELLKIRAAAVADSINNNAALSLEERKQENKVVLAAMKDAHAAAVGSGGGTFTEYNNHFNHYIRAWLPKAAADRILNSADIGLGATEKLDVTRPQSGTVIQ